MSDEQISETEREFREQLQARISAAKDARDFIESPLAQRAILSMRGDLYKMFKKTGHEQSDERDEIWRKEQILDWFESVFTNQIADGKVAEKELNDRISGHSGPP